MTTQWQAFGERLAGAGIVADPVLPPRAPSDAPWYAQVLAGIAAWIAAVLLLASLAAAALPLLEPAAARAVIGAAVCALCLRAGRQPRSAFGTQFVSALSLAGAALLVSAAVSGHSGSLEQVLLAAGVVAAVLWWFNPEPGHRHVSAIVLVAAPVLLAVRHGFATIALGAIAIGAALVWLRQPAAAAAGRDQPLRARGVALAAAVLLLPAAGELLEPWSGIGVSRTDVAVDGAGPGGRPGVDTALLAVVLGFVAVAAARATRSAAAGARFGLADAAWPIAGIVALAAASWQVPGVVACLLVWTLGQSAGRPLLTGAAWLGLAGYLFQLYYQLELTLAAKGVALLLTGTALLAARFVLNRRFGTRR
ncbi:MAG: DUF4401 domain-containing protein [Lautropia sp.]